MDSTPFSRARAEQRQTRLRGCVQAMEALRQPLLPAADTERTQSGYSAAPLIQGYVSALLPGTRLPWQAEEGGGESQGISDMLRARGTSPLGVGQGRGPVKSHSVCAVSGHHEEHVHHHHQGFGDKSISFLGSCVLNFNNITGPAVVVLPLLFQQSGWLLPTLGLLLMWLCSSFAATMLCDAMQRIPGNFGFARRFEYCTLVRHYFGNRWYMVAQVGFNLGLTASNIAAMIVTSQVLDSVALRLLGTSYAVSYSSWPPSIIPSSASISNDVCTWGVTPSGACDSSIVSLGYLITMSLCIPMGLLNLDDNMGFQWISMLGQLLFSFQFAYHFLARALPFSADYCAENGPARTPLIGADVSQVVGICVFAYSYVSTIPSWANEKRPEVNVNRAIWLPSLLGCSLNIMLGLLGAWAYSLVDAQGQPYQGTDNLLNLLDGHSDPRTSSTCPAGVPLVSTATEVSAYLWGILGYVPGIPVLAIMVRYNLQSTGVLGTRLSFFLAVVLPWVLTAFCYHAQILLQFCNWVAIFCQGFINLLVPVLLFRQALLRYPLPHELDSSEVQKPSLLDTTCKCSKAHGGLNVEPDIECRQPDKAPVPLQSDIPNEGDGTPFVASLLGRVQGWFAADSAATRLDSSEADVLEQTFLTLSETDESVASKAARVSRDSTAPYECSVCQAPSPHHAEGKSSSVQPDDIPAVNSVPSWMRINPLMFSSVLAGCLVILVILSICTTLFV